MNIIFACINRNILRGTLMKKLVIGIFVDANHQIVNQQSWSNQANIQRLNDPTKYYKIDANGNILKADSSAAASKDSIDQFIAMFHSKEAVFLDIERHFPFIHSFIHANVFR